MPQNAIPVPAFQTARTAEPAKIFSVPTEMPWGQTWTEKDLDCVIENWQQHQAKGDPRFPNTPVYFIPAASISIGHEQNSSIGQAYAERTDLPAVGWLTELRREGSYLVAMFDGIPEDLAKWVNTGAYKKLSAEFYRDYQGFGPTLRRVALLGANIPECKNLGNLPVMVYNPTAEQQSNPVAFCESLHSYRTQHKHPRFGVDIAGLAFVTFSESNTGAVSMTPEQQALLAALQAALPGTDLSKIDGMALDQILSACKAQAPALNTEDDDPDKLALNAEDDDPDKLALNAEDDDDNDKKPDVAAFAEVIKLAVAGAVEPLKAQLATLATAHAGEQARRDRVEVAAFCERQKAAGKIFPYELDPNVGPTLVDQLLALPTATLATFAEGKLSPRAALMKSIEARPAVARFAERMPQPIAPEDQGKARRAELLSKTTFGRSILAKEKAAK